MRLFYRDTCCKIPTKETSQEAAARARKSGKPGKPGKPGVGKGTGDAARRPATLDVFTIKFHFLGDYSSTIRRVGTTDSFSTQTVGDRPSHRSGRLADESVHSQGELFHRVPKSWYPRTDKKDYESQITHIERRQARLSAIRAQLDTREGKDSNSGGQPSAQCPPSQGESLLELERHYIIGANRNSPITLDSLADRSSWGARDPYLVVCCCIPIRFYRLVY